MSKISEWFYRVLEKIDGEKGPRVIPYKAAERLKLFVLRFIH